MCPGPAAPAPAASEAAQDPQAALRAQIELLRQQLEALQQKVAALEARERSASGGAGGRGPAAPAARRPSLPPPGRLPVYGNTSALSKIFNPDIAVVGNFVGRGRQERRDPFPALRLNEAEVSFQAIVDPYARADFFLAASPRAWRSRKAS